jgi:hypothetical protein
MEAANPPFCGSFSWRRDSLEATLLNIALVVIR